MSNDLCEFSILCIEYNRLNNKIILQMTNAMSTHYGVTLNIYKEKPSVVHIRNSSGSSVNQDTGKMSVDFLLL